MNGDVKAESKLVGCLDDREVLESLDNYFDVKQSRDSHVIFDNGHPVPDDRVFAIHQHPLQEEVSVNVEKELMGSCTPLESPPMESSIPTPAACDGKFNDEKFTDPYVKPDVQPMGRKRRRRPSLGEESGDFKNQLVSMLENNSRILTAHLESQNLNSELDRAQRKEHAENLVGVLGKLADAMSKIAERL